MNRKWIVWRFFWPIFNAEKAHLQCVFCPNYGETQSLFRKFVKFSNFQNFFLQTCQASKMKPIREVWVRRRLRRLSFWWKTFQILYMGNFGQNRQKFEKFFFHWIQHQNIHIGFFLYASKMLHSRDIAKVLFLEHLRF